MKEILITVDQNSFPSGIIPPPFQSYNPSRKFTFNLSTLLLHIGIVTAQPINHELTINKYWAHLRYINCFQKGKNLKTTSEWQDIDSHQKTILSDDLGMGGTSMVLSELMHIDFWTPTSYFIKHLSSLSALSTNKNGTYKAPDFITLDRNFNLHIIECKGTQKSLTALSKQMVSGQTQKGNLYDPYNIINEKLVGGVFVPQYNSTEQAQIKLIDPDFNLNFEKIEKKQLIFLSYQAQLAKELHLFDMHNLGNLIAKVDLINDDSLKVSWLIEEINKVKQNNQIIRKSNTLSENIFFKKRFNENILESMIKNIDLPLRDVIDDFTSQHKNQTDKLFYPTYRFTASNSTYSGIFGLEVEIGIY